MRAPVRCVEGEDGSERQGGAGDHRAEDGHGLAGPEADKVAVLEEAALGVVAVHQGDDTWWLW
jgi:hypothetical protein